MHSPIKILLVEDDSNLGYLLVENFKARDIEVHLCAGGEAGFMAFEQNAFDLCILDVMMPKKDGFTLGREIRRLNDEIPIIFLTAKSQDADKIIGFDIGADDYVTKPFSAQELYMRIKAILRRGKVFAKEENRQIFQLGKLNFNYFERTLSNGEGQKRLSSKEADMLKHFAENCNCLISRKDILLKVWGTDDYFTAKSMDVYLTRLRKLLKDDNSIEIQNVHGTGFKLITK